MSRSQATKLVLGVVVVALGIVAMIRNRSATAEPSLRSTADGLAISGRVEDANGQPVAGAKITVRSDETWKRELSAADGSFRASVPMPGEFIVEVRADGLMQPEDLRTVVSGDRPTSDVLVHMIRSASISGRVRWDDGRTVKMASVSAIAVPREGQPRLGGPQAIAAVIQGSPFTLEGLHPEYLYRVTAQTMEPAMARAILEGVTPGTGDLDLVLKRRDADGTTLTGTVLDARTGEPVQNYELLNGLWIRGVHDGESTLVSDPAGKFRLEGRWSLHNALQVVADGYPPKTIGPIALDRPEVEIVVRLERAGNLLVAVVDETGAAIADAELHVHRAASDEDPELFAETWEARTDERGLTHFPGQAPGRYMFQAAKEDRLSDLSFATVVGEQCTDATVVILPQLELGKLIVSVKHSSGRLLAGVPVDMNNMTGLGIGRGPGSMARESTKGTTDGEGFLTFSDVLPGIYWVWPRVEGYFYGPRWVAVRGATTTRYEFLPD